MLLLFSTVLLFIYFKAGDYFFFCFRVLIHFLQVSYYFLRENSLTQEDICQKTSLVNKEDSGSGESGKSIWHLSNLCIINKSSEKQQKT